MTAEEKLKKLRAESPNYVFTPLDLCVELGVSLGHEGEEFNVIEAMMDFYADQFKSKPVDETKAK